MDKINTISRYAIWLTGNSYCNGIWKNEVCIFSIEDIPRLISQKHFILNKFLLEYDPISYQCMEEWLDYRVKQTKIINMFFYCQFIAKHSSFAKCPSLIKLNG